MKNLHISELFSSVQGEGPSVGQPCVFLRLKGCVLNCQWCDTLETWKKGEPWVFDKLFNHFRDNGWFKAFAEKGYHLVITGGDPLLQQASLCDFFSYLEIRGLKPSRWYIEVENQGTLMPGSLLIPYISQWNISPKLANSGEPYAKRINTEVLQFHAQNLKSVVTFKFPIQDREELKEVEDICQAASIPRRRVMLMPLAATREAFECTGRAVAQFCLEKGYRLSCRLHLTLWDKAVGV